MRIPSVEGLVLYDGDCAFCVGWLHFCSLVSRRRGFVVDTLQAEWLPDSLGMTPDEVLRDLRLLTVAFFRIGPNIAKSRPLINLHQGVQHDPSSETPPELVGPPVSAQVAVSMLPESQAHLNRRLRRMGGDRVCSP
jgi:hypothetical protein